MQPLISADKSQARRKPDRPSGTQGWKRLVRLEGARPIAVVEIIVGMAVVLGACYLFQPTDPLLLNMSFPWIWLAATVFALRYGALLGVLAGLCIVFAWLVFYGQGAVGGGPPMSFIGGLVQLILVGHFCDLWTSRIDRALTVNEYLGGRLAAITNNHYLLRISHERLEKDLLAKPTTLRDALGHLRGLAASDGQSDGLPNMQAMLEYVALSCQIGEACVFPVVGKSLSSGSVACIGERFQLNSQDPLVQECIATQALVHFRQLDELDSAYLACVPILFSGERLAGVLVVRKMPFLSLNFDNLQLLLVLINYYADGIEQRMFVDPVLQRVPMCPPDFALELGRLARMRRVSGVQSSLVALVIPRGPVGDSLFDQLNHYHRALDLSWSFVTELAQVSVTLLPLADQHDVGGYLLRIESDFKSRFNTDFVQAHIASYRSDIDPNNPAEELLQFLLRCGYHV